MDDNKYMQKAIMKAKQALKYDEVPIGAIIVKNGEIIASAYNRKNVDNLPTKHAEIIAIEKACRKLNNWRLNDCVMYVTLEPCPMCASAIQQARISKVIYGTSNNDINNKKIISDIFNTSPRVDIENGILENKCSILLSTFFKNKR